MFASFINLLPTGFDVKAASVNLGNLAPILVSGLLILVGCWMILSGAVLCHKGFSGQGGSGRYLGLGLAEVIVGAVFAIKSSIYQLRGFGNGTAKSIMELGQTTVTSYLPTLTALPLHSLIALL